MPTQTKRSPEIATADADDLQPLRLRADVLFKLRQRGVTSLAQLAGLRASELRQLPGLGYASLQRIEKALADRGLALLPDALSPMQQVLREARQRRGRPASTLAPEDSVAALGLSSLQVRRLLQQDILTLRDLATLTLDRLRVLCGQATSGRIVQRLRDIGLTLADKPDALALWRAGLVDRHHVPWPDDSAPVDALAPWLGKAVVEAVQRAGVTSVAALKARAQEGQPATPSRNGDPMGGVGAEDPLAALAGIGRAHADKIRRVLAQRGDPLPASPTTRPRQATPPVSPGQPTPLMHAGRDELPPQWPPPMRARAGRRAR